MLGRRYLKVCRGAIAQALVWAKDVAVRAPHADEVTGVVQLEKPVHAEAVGPELVMNARDEAMLDRLAPSDERELDAMRIGPRVERLRDPCGSIVEDDARRRAARVSDLGEHRGHGDAWQREVRLQGQTLPRARIHDAQHADASAICERISDDVVRPLRIRPGMNRPRGASGAHRLAGLRLQQPKARARVDAADALEIHVSAVPGEQDAQAAVAPALTLGCLRAEGRHQRRIARARRRVLPPKSD